ncbi:MarR family transcriptional regulator [Lelliottia sp. V106_10]|jgi:MarR family transcriptional regulator for hemolysin|uniref:MarR family transcriptional regulator n=1 Tax=Lelliottia wanjuensis TaxID=3050585 RepID=A0AAP4FZI2_9ENTR|nr:MULTISPECIES: MarR family transcriptional regulator [unclassified Lelliottia]MDI3362822.1 MarR family transcriptional regulator [Lelliottia sp. V89_13]MDK9357721.1 MarR family transcriptional regulator [Lelliottia sp. V106_16]MDK9366370.1 MarR family transcriptional regulator [Lelliottia sp. V106_12]MDK9372787.1 MarR family transcriptional regulator [Lelliottia sp. V106_10]MDK9547621.1 MarR family transcriptional regulator [Lelliottia sp. V89_5]
MTRDYTQLTDLLRENHSAWQQILEPVLNEIGVTFVDRVILDKLDSQSGQTKNELANQLGTVHQNLTRSIARLEQQGLLRSSKNNPADKRQIFLEITREGSAMNRRVNEKINDIWNDILGNVSAQEIQLFETVLVRLNSNLRGLKIPGK